ncbi:helix-turn-helix and ligand-binding sensor domain-containing protein [Zunongwangia atlantica]|uniref:Two-component system sensor histidine kinase/response regulator hybrid n=1 Tax=Zunongwangia atlantica 22II14-10F7 TaxID=1185767 RepID=A0A1Y1T7S6_9FLAO|nr:triple tyrosine motif-containing protein [Zunongwangia atlantica]ORL47106.1 two-component system sensor histidine kinase/response regulator hybrid [Zunongwangia atlantica 22II14-10F7]
MRWLILLLLCIPSLSKSQELPPITNFDTKTYNAGNQNWMVGQGDNSWMYFANNSGLLSFNGEQWALYKMKDGSPIRSVKVVDSLIFTGAYMDFGYWQKNSLGSFNYTSLLDKLPSEIRDGEQIWHIEALGNYIVFQSLSRLFSYHLDNRSIAITDLGKTISNLFKSGNTVYFQVAEDGLYSIKSGGIEREVGFEQLGAKAIIQVFEWNNQKVALTRDDGLFAFGQSKWDKINVPNYPISASFFSAEYTNDNKLVLGSIGDGLFILNLLDGNIQQIVQPDILNNTILSVFEDQLGQIWCGLDNGISLIEKDSQFSIFSDITGKLGTVYCSIMFENELYLGTNQGLYKRNDRERDFNLIEGTSGQVWSLQEFNDQLFIGHDRGTFTLKKDNLSYIFDGLGTWQIVPFKDGFIQGHYNGISYFKEGQTFNEISYLDGFNLSSRNILNYNDQEIWVGHDHKGIFKLKPDLSNFSIKLEKNYTVDYKDASGIKLFKFNDDIYYSTAQSIFRYDAQKDIFTEENQLNTVFKDIDRNSGISHITKDGKWWSFSENEMYYTVKDAFQEGLNVESIPLSYEFRNISNGFENLSQIGENRYLVGSNHGYAIFNTPFKKHEIPDLEINKIEIANKDLNFKIIDKNRANPVFKNSENYFNFYFNTPVYQRFSNITYSYRIKGFTDTWTPFRNVNMANFENLPYGDYEFQVKAKYDGQETNIAVYPFVIEKPWFLSNLAIFIYVLFLIIIVLVIHHFYTRYYNKRHAEMIKIEKEKAELQQLEAAQEIMQLKNEQLEADVSSKNRELAASTMSIIRKSEVLNQIKNELGAVSKLEDIKAVLKTIDANINEEDNWKFFKEAFDNADKDFLQTVKAKHPNLTSNDLKLCAYLRLNLSSKEIAPLLNISVRSVEIKRYRLRKKMDLAHEEGLVEYILSF